MAAHTVRITSQTAHRTIDAHIELLAHTTAILSTNNVNRRFTVLSDTQDENDLTDLISHHECEFVNDLAITGFFHMIPLRYFTEYEVTNPIIRFYAHTLDHDLGRVTNLRNIPTSRLATTLTHAYGTHPSLRCALQHCTLPAHATPPPCPLVHCTLADHQALIAQCPQHHCTPAEHAALAQQAQCNQNHLTPAEIVNIRNQQQATTLALVQARLAVPDELGIYVAIMRLERSFRYGSSTSHNTRTLSLVQNLRVEIASAHFDGNVTNLDNQNDTPVATIISLLSEISRSRYDNHRAIYSAFRCIHTATQQASFLNGQIHNCRFGPMCPWNNIVPYMNGTNEPSNEPGSAFAYLDARFREFLDNMSRYPQRIQIRLIRVFSSREDARAVMAMEFPTLDQLLADLPDVEE
jgi:hypothetical protein